MLALVGKLTLAIILWAIFVYIILYIPYPPSFTQASAYQLLSFFGILFLAVTFTLNIFLNSIFPSSSISLGVIFLIILKALGSLNIVTAGLTIVAVYLLFTYFKKSKNSGLTNLSKIPKLSSFKRRKR